MISPTSNSRKEIARHICAVCALTPAEIKIVEEAGSVK
jgi:hypothetical protein